MGFLFGLFRFLTWGNIIVVGFIMFMGALLLLANPMFGLFILIVYGTLLTHNLRCLKLQKNYLNPDYLLPKEFYTQMIILSLLGFFYSMSSFYYNLFSMRTVTDKQFMEMVNTSRPANQPPATLEQAQAIIGMVYILAGIHTLAIAANCVISSVFLNRWKKGLAEKEEEDIFTEN